MPGGNRPTNTVAASGSGGCAARARRASASASRSRSRSSSRPLAQPTINARPSTSTGSAVARFTAPSAAAKSG